MKKLFELTSQIAKEGVSLAPRVVPADASFFQYQHSPKNDCVARGNRSRSFYHVYKPEERDEGEQGYFHTPTAGYISRRRPTPQKTKKLPAGKLTQNVFHFGTLSFGLDDMLLGWFTANYWVTYKYCLQMPSRRGSNSMIPVGANFSDRAT